VAAIQRSYNLLQQLLDEAASAWSSSDAVKERNAELQRLRDREEVLKTVAAFVKRHAAAGAAKGATVAAGMQADDTGSMPVMRHTASSSSSSIVQPVPAAVENLPWQQLDQSPADQSTATAGTTAAGATAAATDAALRPLAVLAAATAAAAAATANAAAAGDADSNEHLEPCFSPTHGSEQWADEPMQCEAPPVDSTLDYVSDEESAAAAAVDSTLDYVSDGEQAAPVKASSSSSSSTASKSKVRCRWRKVCTVIEYDVDAAPEEKSSAAQQRQRVNAEPDAECGEHRFRYRKASDTGCVQCDSKGVRVCTTCDRCVRCYRAQRELIGSGCSGSGEGDGRWSPPPADSADDVAVDLDAHDGIGRRRSGSFTDSEGNSSPRKPSSPLKSTAEPAAGYAESVAQQAVASAPCTSSLAVRLDRAIYDAFTTAKVDGDDNEYKPLMALLQCTKLYNFRRATGETPLHAAAYNNKAHLVEAWLAAGASADQRDGHGQTPLALAQQRDAGLRAQAYRENRQAPNFNQTIAVLQRHHMQRAAAAAAQEAAAYQAAAAAAAAARAAAAATAAAAAEAAAAEAALADAEAASPTLLTGKRKAAAVANSGTATEETANGQQQHKRLRPSPWHSVAQGTLAAGVLNGAAPMMTDFAALPPAQLLTAQQPFGVLASVPRGMATAAHSASHHAAQRSIDTSAPRSHTVGSNTLAAVLGSNSLAVQPLPRSEARGAARSSSGSKPFVNRSHEQSGQQYAQRPRPAGGHQHHDQRGDQRGNQRGDQRSGRGDTRGRRDSRDRSDRRPHHSSCGRGRSDSNSNTNR
jgi:trimeric autotransporter adhesin